MWKKYLENESGYALVIAILAISVIMILGLSVLATTNHSKNSVDREDKDQSAYYIAEAGLNLKKAELQKIETLFATFQAQQKENEKDETIKKMTSEEFVAAFKVSVSSQLGNATADTYYASELSQCTNKVNCSKLLERKNSLATVKTTANITNNSFSYTITSIGAVDQQKRKIATTLSYVLAAKAYKVANNSFTKYAIHAINTLTMTDGQIIGNIGFSGAQPNSQTFPFSGNSGSVSYTGASSNTVYKACSWWKNDNSNECGNDNYKTIATAVKNKDVVFNDTVLPNIPKFPFNEFPDLSKEPSTRKVWDSQIPNDAQTKFPSSGVLLGNYKLLHGDITNTTKLTINNNTVNLYIDSFDINNPSISIIGNGKLNIYTNSFKQLNSGSINFGNNDVTIYANNSIDFTNNAGISNAKSLTLKTRSINFTSAANFNIQNDLNMYVHDSLKLTNSMKMQTKNWNIYYAGLTNPEFNGGFKNAVNIDSLYSGIAINTGVHLGGNITIRGETPSYGGKPNIDVEISGGSKTLTPQYFYAPNSDITLSGSGTVVGSLIGKTIAMSGGSSVEFKPPTSTSNSGSSELEETAEAGIITSSFTNNSTGGSIEID